MAKDLPDVVGFARSVEHLPRSIDLINNVAWLLATHQDLDWRDPPSAMLLAESVCRQTGHTQVRLLDTLAAAQAAHGDFNAARHTLQQALRLRNTRSVGRDQLTAMRARQRMYEKGIAHTDRSSRQLKLPPPPEIETPVAASRARAYFIFAKMLWDQQAWPEVAGACELAMESAPSFRPAYMVRTEAFVRGGKLDEAADQLADVLLTFGEDPVVMMALAELLTRAGRTGEAVQVLQRTLRVRPQWLHVANNLAWILATDEQADVRNGDLSVQISEALCGRTAHPPLPFLDTLAAAYAEAGRFHAAVAAIDRALAELAEQQAPDAALERKLKLKRRLYWSRRPFRNYFRLHVQLAGVAMAADRVDDAVGHFQQALRERPNHPAALLGLALVLEEIGQVNEALELTSRALLQRPAWPAAERQLAWMLATHQEPNPGWGKQAVRVAKRVNKLTNNSDPHALDTLAAAYAADGNFELAVQHVDQALAAVRLDEGEAGDEASLLEDLQLRRRLYLAKQRFTTVSNAHRTLGVRALAESRIDAAAKEFTAALQADPRDADAALLLATVRKMQGRAAAAKRLYEHCLVLRPDWPIAKNKLAWLLATVPYERMRNPTRALRLASELCSDEQEPNPHHYDVLAAALAATGRFHDAAGAINRALEHVPSKDEKLRKTLAARQAIYLSGRAYREEW